MEPVRAAVVGFGAWTPLGKGSAATFERLLAGDSAIKPIERFDASRYPVTFAAEVDLQGTAPEITRTLLDAVLSEALTGVDLSGVAPERIGVFMGSEAARPDMRGLAAQLRSGTLATPEEVAEHLPVAATRHVVARVGARGPQVTVSTACTSSGQAIGEALLALRRGEVDVAIAGGVDVLVHPLMVTGFARLGALSERNHDPAAASRPFDLGRDGFVLGEGAGVLVLTRPDLADRVGSVKGFVSGFGCSCNAWRITDSPPDGRGAAAAMSAALSDAGRTPEEVVYINAHGTSTQQNDVSEARGIRGALGSAADTAWVSSTKSMMGHLVAACGAVEAIVALQALAARRAPITRNLDQPDPDCVLRHVRGAPAALEPGVALSNAFGFGGSNATLVLEIP